MKKMLAVLTFSTVLLSTTLVHALDDWTTKDTVLQTIFTAVTILDWRQTHRIVEMGHLEENKILGERPSHNTINTYFISALVVHAGISYLLPREYRTLWQAGSIGFELAIVNHNYNAGIRLSF